MVKNNLHPEIINFLTKSINQIQNISIGTNGTPVIVHYVGELGYFGFPNLSQIVAFEHHDGKINYWFNGKNHSENNMLRMINLKSFI
jgi:hypothetical protein